MSLMSLMSPPSLTRTSLPFFPHNLVLVHPVVVHSLDQLKRARQSLYPQVQLDKAPLDKLEVDRWLGHSREVVEVAQEEAAQEVVAQLKVKQQEPSHPKQLG
jgi:hypothetical protein